MKNFIPNPKQWLLLLLILLTTQSVFAQQEQHHFTKADTLRGTITPQRAWWQVTYYDLHVTVQPKDSAITGYNNITYRVTDSPKKMQIDLQHPLQIDDVKQDGQSLSFHRVEDTNAYFIVMPKDLQKDKLYTLSVYYHGRPKVAENAPWDGGFIWTQDSLGNDWVSTANQGLGASVWWPNKDHQTAEPDSMSINITLPDPMVDVSNGRLRKTTHHDNGMTTWSWFVSNPINNYNASVNAGNYVNFTDTLHGKKGVLDMSFWALKQHLSKAKKQFQQAKPMLRCFEDWFGPYPFYEDSYKLVEAPHLGMEHQSAVAYGNGFQNGYHGTDLSGSGWGMKWDFIIVHESGHEWWGNSISSKDIADMWVHEGFTSYSESIYTECQYGKKAAEEYTIGLRDRIQNKSPIIGPYGVNSEGFGGTDMYYKGHNMLHTIRHIIDNDSTWKHILQGLQHDFYHQTVSSKEVENYINEHSDYDLSPVFDQYLRHANIPVLQYSIADGTLRYRWKADVEEFDMPVKVTLSDNSFTFIHPTEEWQEEELSLSSPDNFQVDKNFYVKTQQMETKTKAVESNKN